jgi:hypothetical protein
MWLVKSSPILAVNPTKILPIIPPYVVLLPTDPKLTFRLIQMLTFRLITIFLGIRPTTILLGITLVT